MDIKIDVEIGNNSDKIKQALDEQIEQALIAIGLTAETYAKLPEERGGHMPVDTGRLKNSITYAIAGQSPHITSYRADKGNEGGGYSGSMPQDKDGKPRSVYIGSNVEYAAAVENGISGKQAGKHYLRSALSDHIPEYKELMEKALKGK